MSLKWERYPEPASRAKFYASIMSRNGGNGCVWVKERAEGDGYELVAASEMTGRDWKSPSDVYPTIEAAMAAAEERWA